MKGKVTQCLAFGLPVVTTKVGAEGLEGHDEECLLIADDTQGLATQVIRIYRDDDLWVRLSNAGQTLIAERCSMEVVSERLTQLLDSRELAMSGGRGNR
jgi:glycosyltransferase involved in cell wall biosynthesis